MTQPLPSYLIDRYQSWKSDQFREHQELYAQLAAEGQQPRTMLISCCDSRVEGHAFFGGAPGELFTLRNVANLVTAPTPQEGLHGTAAAVEYAVTALQVANIVVMGHSQCGGVKAYYSMRQGQEGAPAADSVIGCWLQSLRPAYQRASELKEPNADPLRQLEQQSVLVSIENLLAFACVHERVAAQTLSLHAAWLDIATATLYHYVPKTQTFISLDAAI